MSEYKTSCITELNEKLIYEWKLLWKESEYSNFFNSYEWFLICLKTFKTSSFRIFVCYKGKALVGIFPTIIQKRFGIEFYTSLGTKNEDATILLKSLDYRLIKNFFESVLTYGNICITKIEDRVVSELKKVFPKALIYAISINSSFSLNSDLHRYFSSRVRQGIRSTIRKNHEVLKFKRFDSKSNLEKFLKVMISLEQNSSKKQKEKDIFSDDLNITLFKEIVKTCPELISVSFLYYKDEPIAYMFGISFKDIFFEFHTAYLSNYSHLSPGKLLLHFLLEDILKKGEVIKFKFGFELNGVHPEYNLHFDVYYSKNYLVLCWLRLITALRRLKQIILPTKHFPDAKFLFRMLKGSEISEIVKNLNDFGNWALGDLIK